MHLLAATPSAHYLPPSFYETRAWLVPELVRLAKSMGPTRVTLSVKLNEIWVGEKSIGGARLTSEGSQHRVPPCVCSGTSICSEHAKRVSAA